MEKKTMGSFIAALRKANGLTQQELADMLNISNKAVSRWERDECAPDISLIPPLAEILGVTCDELLKGERIFNDDGQGRSVKVEKQIGAIVNRSMFNYQTLIWISLALSLVGLVCMFGISYGAYKPIIGFVVMSLFAIAAFILAAIFTSKMKGMKNETFDSAEQGLLNKYNKTLGVYSYMAFCAAVLVVLVSVPYLFFCSFTVNYGYVTIRVNGVLSLESYMLFFGGLAPALVILFLLLKDTYCSWITEQPYKKRAEKLNVNLLVMNIAQFALIVLVVISFIVLPETKSPTDRWQINDTLLLIACFFPVVCLVVFIVFMAVCSNRKTLFLSGLRNFLLSIPAISLYRLRQNGIDFDIVMGQIGIETWHVEYVFLTVELMLFVFMVFELIKTFKKSGSVKS